MTKDTNEFLLRMSGLRAANEKLSEELLRPKQGITDAMSNVERGDLKIEAVLVAGAPEIREDLTNAIIDFEGARHRASIGSFRASTQRDIPGGDCSSAWDLQATREPPEPGSRGIGGADS